jgi:hypothetical protein
VSRHSFQPRLTNDELNILSLFDTDWSPVFWGDTSDYIMACRLVSRGLLQQDRKKARITRRGSLMLKRHEAEQRHRKWQGEAA